jgi:hypothetical protein
MIVAVAFWVNISNAQEKKTDYHDRLQFGIKAGANFSNVFGTKGDEFKATGKFGFATGTFVAIPIGKFMGIQPELLFSQKGFKGTSRILDNTYEFTRTTSYIEMPLLFSYKPIKLLNLLAGPQYSYLVQQSDVFENVTPVIQQDDPGFENDNVRKHNLGFLVGTDINFGHITLGARAGCDFLNNSEGESSTAPRYKNVWYQATLGFRFFSD